MKLAKLDEVGVRYIREHTKLALEANERLGVGESKPLQRDATASFSINASKNLSRSSVAQESAHFKTTKGTIGFCELHQIVEDSAPDRVAQPNATPILGVDLYAYAKRHPGRVSRAVRSLRPDRAAGSPRLTGPAPRSARQPTCVTIVHTGMSLNRTHVYDSGSPFPLAARARADV